MISSSKPILLLQMTEYSSWALRISKLLINFTMLPTMLIGKLLKLTCKVQERNSTSSSHHQLNKKSLLHLTTRIQDNYHMDAKCQVYSTTSLSSRTEKFLKKLQLTSKLLTV